MDDGRRRKYGRAVSRSVWSGGSLSDMDEGLPIAYEVLSEGVPVYCSDGQTLGTVEHVVAAPALDIFHGLIVSTEAGSRSIAADDVAALHERGVDLRIDSAAAANLPEPQGGAPALRVRDPGIKVTRWRHLLDELEGIAPQRRDWKSED